MVEVVNVLLGLGAWALVLFFWLAGPITLIVAGFFMPFTLPFWLVGFVVTFFLAGVYFHAKRWVLVHVYGETVGEVW